MVDLLPLFRMSIYNDGDYAPMKMYEVFNHY